jgi:23S rRNA pseudouridine2605 synthase
MKSKHSSTISNSRSLANDKTIRLNKFLSNAGICSRREADELIKMGLVQINGQIITEMGFKVKYNDEVKYDGSRIQQSPPEYLLLNKPKGFVATARGAKIKKSVQELISSGVKTKIPPIGDMGRPITGLLFFTSDEILRKKLNNSTSIPMIYQVTLDQNITNDMMKKLKEGQMIFEKMHKVNTISHVDGKSKKEVGVEVHSISPAILQKLFASIGLKVIQMDRVVYGGLNKKDLPRGNWRKLSSKEIGFMKMFS